jgi:hypothetical protein
MFHYYRDEKQQVRFNGFGHRLERDSLKTARGTRTHKLMHPYVREPNLIMT